MSDRIPHSLFWDGWHRVEDTYRNFAKHRVSAPLAFAVTTLAIAVGLVVLRVYEYTHGRLP